MTVTNDCGKMKDRLADLVTVVAEHFFFLHPLSDADDSKGEHVATLSQQKPPPASSGAGPCRPQLHPNYKRYMVRPAAGPRWWIKFFIGQSATVIAVDLRGLAI